MGKTDADSRTFRGYLISMKVAVVLPDSLSKLTPLMQRNGSLTERPDMGGVAVRAQLFLP